MQRILQINIAGRILPVEEDGYVLLKDYIQALERQFTGDDGKEIIEDIENRIAELFTIRLQSGAPAIDKKDVQKVIETLGAANDLGGGTANKNQSGYRQQSQQQAGQQQYQGRQYNTNRGRLLRDPYDRIIGGVCSGLSQYFDLDPVIIRLVMVVLFLTAGIGLVAYLIAWAVIPAAQSREELNGMTNGNPMTFHDFTRNMGEELEELKKRGEEMSRDLRDFFSKKK